MATAYPILGQQKPGAATPTDLFTCATTYAVVSSLVICNQSAVADTFRISVSLGGGATATKDYIYYDLTLAGNDTFIFTGGITMSSTDVMRCYSTNGTCSFNLFGSTIS